MTTAEKVYRDAQAACGPEVGDYVRVIRKAYNHEAGWDNAWPTNMDKTIGMVGKVVEVSRTGIRISFASPVNECWYFPYFVLEKTDKPEEKPEHKFMPFDRVLVRDRSDEPWRPNIFSVYSKGEPFPYYCLSSCYVQCIPYEGNEHLVGTTEEPNG